MVQLQVYVEGGRGVSFLIWPTGDLRDLYLCIQFSLQQVVTFYKENENQNLSNCIYKEHVTDKNFAVSCTYAYNQNFYRPSLVFPSPQPAPTIPG